MGCTIHRHCREDCEKCIIETLKGDLDKRGGRGVCRDNATWRDQRGRTGAYQINISEGQAVKTSSAIQPVMGQAEKCEAHTALQTSDLSEVIVC